MRSHPATSPRLRNLDRSASVVLPLAPMGIEVSKEFEEEIQQRVAQGPYTSAKDFLRASVKRADEYRAQIRAAIDEGTAQARRGELTDGEAFLDRLDAELARDETPPELSLWKGRVIGELRRGDIDDDPA